MERSMGSKIFPKMDSYPVVLGHRLEDSLLQCLHRLLLDIGLEIIKVGADGMTRGASGEFLDLEKIHSTRV
jgi:hypothetical protein